MVLPIWRANLACFSVVAVISMMYLGTFSMMARAMRMTLVDLPFLLGTTAAAMISSNLRS
jgi:hypothetical protein